MDETDMEAFDKFIERHWGSIKSNLETVPVSAGTEETRPRRGRPSNK